jgi:hypothetical protein
MESFDTIDGALNRIETLRASKETAYLTHELVSAVYDSLGRMESNVCNWIVSRSKGQPMTTSSVRATRGEGIAQ